MIFLNKNQLYESLVRKFFYTFLISIVFIISIPVYAITENYREFITIDEIHSGMKGIGKTVFSGIRIEEFEVEVIDVIHGTKISHPYILVKLSGDKIDNNGGISAGMSGSPVYFEGKLAGAISHAWEMSEHNLCLITPIDIMLTLFDYIGKEKQNVYSNASINNAIISLGFDENLNIKLTDLEEILNKINNFSTNNQNSINNFRYIQSPLLIGGFRGRAIDYIKNNLQQYGITLIQTISEFPDINNELEINTGIKKILPGSAVGVQLSTGDVSAISIGTATYCQDNYVLAFGHPFLHYGNVSYLFSAVYIYHSFPSIVMPFKIGSPYLLLGEVIQDRNAGILARINRFPSIVSCKINVFDADRDMNIVSGTKVVPQKTIVQSIIPALLIQSVDNAIDRIGQGTANVKFSLRHKDTGKILYYDNIFFSENDIAVEISQDLNNLFDLLYNNFYERIDLNEIVINVTIKEHNQKAIIKDVKLDIKECYPGDIIEIPIIITPFRQADEQKMVQIKLPDDITADSVVVVVRGGSSKEEMSDKSIPPDNQNYLLNGWPEIEKHLKEKEKNNQIIAEVVLLNDNGRSDLMIRNETDDTKNNLKVILDTNFVIEGYHEIFLNIKNKNISNTE
jgi:hypothetical protein